MKHLNVVCCAVLTAVCSLAAVCSNLALMTANADWLLHRIEFGGKNLIDPANLVEDTEDPTYTTYRMSVGGGTATYVYDSDIRRLTLENITVDVEDMAGLYIDGGTAISLIGTNSITVRDTNQEDGIECGGIDFFSGPIGGDGSLTIATNGRYGIHTNSGLAFYTTVTITGLDGNYADAAIYNEGDSITIDRAKLNVTGEYYGISQNARFNNVTIHDSDVIAEANCDIADAESSVAGIYVFGGDENLGHGPLSYGLRVSGTSRLTVIGGIVSSNEAALPWITPSGDHGKRGTVTVKTSNQRNGDDARVIASFSVDTHVGGLDTAWVEIRDSEFGASNSGSSTGNDRQKGDECNHDYGWVTYKVATATTDGIMRYRCKYCGDVEYEVPTAAYYVFNKETQESIQKAAPYATVTMSTPIFISFHEMVRDALVARPDVTLIVDYKNDGKEYEMTIPAGSGETLNTLFGDSQFAGFLYLGGAFSTVER